MRSLLQCLVLLIVALASPASAANRYALVIGNDAYKALPPLKKAVNDAKAVGDALEKIDFTVLRGNNLSLSEMQDRLFDLTGRVEPGDTVFFFFAGHGVAIDGGNYLLPIDTQIPKGAQAENRIKFAGLAESTLLQQVKLAGAQLTIMVLDACRDNPFATAGTRSIGNARGLQRAPDERGVFAIYSAGFGQTALDRLSDEDPNPNSVFTRILSPALSEPGLSLVDVAYRVSEKVEELAKTVQHEQSPAYYDQARGQRVFLAGLPPTLETSKLVETPLATDPCRDAIVHWSAIGPINDRALYEEHIKFFGSCAFASLARTALRKLDLPLVAKINECDRLTANWDDHDRPKNITGVPFDTIGESAVAACEVALTGSPKERRLIFQLGRAYDAIKDYEKAAELYRKAGDAGSALAMRNIGVLSMRGSGVGQDYAEAMRWYQRASNAGDALSTSFIGELYENGQGVKQDYSEAMRWYVRAADAGSANALHMMAKLYDQGLGVEADASKSAELMERSLKQGNMTSANELQVNANDWSLEFRKQLQRRLRKAKSKHPAKAAGQAA